MELTVTIPDADVADLQAYMTKCLLILYPGRDTSGEDVLQIMLDDQVMRRSCEAAISIQRWVIKDATTQAELDAAIAAENAARDAKTAIEAALIAARV